jgi:outer membrane receptor for ferric coprogen and ferric-rhodotorulic acid
MYEIDRHFAVYLSYADIALSNGATVGADGRLLPAIDGVNVETGIKSTWLGGELSTSLAFYRATQSGLPQDDPDAPPSRRSATCCYVSSGTDMTRGIDAEIHGRPAAGWLVEASYSYNTYAKNDFRSRVTPRHLFKAWSNWELPAPWERWTIGADLHAQSSIYNRGSRCLAADDLGFCNFTAVINVTQRGYAILNLRGGYRIDSHWRGVVTVGNIFDRSYIQTIGSPRGGNWYGEPRSVQLRVDADY